MGRKNATLTCIVTCSGTILTDNNRLFLKAFIDNDDKYKLGIKLYAVYQLSKGKSSRELEDLYNTSFKLVCNWADRFDREG
jgi:hypothetical protein